MNAKTLSIFFTLIKYLHSLALDLSITQNLQSHTVIKFLLQYLISYLGKVLKTLTVTQNSSRRKKSKVFSGQ